MRLYTLLRDVEITRTNLADLSAEVCGITDHSDRVRPGDVFVCLSGIHFDGHDYIDRAREAGAALILAERMTGELAIGGVPYIITPSTRRALALLWNTWYDYPAAGLRLVALTGTNGKSSSAYILRSIFEAAGSPCGIIGSIENSFGSLVLPKNPMTTPDPQALFSILAAMRDAGAGTVVMEASSHALALDKLYGLRFAAGIYTGLSPEHLDFHPTMQDYAAAKARLFSMCDITLANADDAWFHAVTDGALGAVKTYSVKGSGDYAAHGIDYPAGGGISYSVLCRTELFTVESHLSGRFNVYNTLGCAGCAHALGIPSQVIGRGIKDLKVIPGRMERVENTRGIAIIIDYAHTPAALEAAITEVRRYTKGRVITLFGCGGDRDKSKRPFMGRVATELSDMTVLTSDNPRNEDPEDIIADIVRGVTGGPFVIIPNRREAIAYAIATAKPTDSVLIAGKGHEDYQITREGSFPFNERAIIEEIINH